MSDKDTSDDWAFSVDTDFDNLQSASVFSAVGGVLGTVLFLIALPFILTALMSMVAGIIGGIAVLITALVLPWVMVLQLLGLISTGVSIGALAVVWVGASTLFILAGSD